MPEDVIPDDVRQFVLENIDSISQLEGLLLFRASREASLNCEEIAQRLYISEEEAKTLVVKFLSRGFLIEKEKSSYQYRPESPAFETIIGRLADTYRRYLVPLTHLIHSKHKSRVQKFADAFRIRKD